MSKAAKTYEDEFRAVFEMLCAYRGIKTWPKKAKAVGMKESTLRAKFKDPATFVARELRMIYTVLGFSPEQRDLLNHSGRMKY